MGERGHGRSLASLARADNRHAVVWLRRSRGWADAAALRLWGFSPQAGSPPPKPSFAAPAVVRLRSDLELLCGRGRIWVASLRRLKWGSFFPFFLAF